MSKRSKSVLRHALRHLVFAGSRSTTSNTNDIEVLTERLRIDVSVDAFGSVQNPFHF